VGLVVLVALSAAVVVVVTRNSGTGTRPTPAAAPPPLAAVATPPALETTGRDWPVVQRSLSGYLGWLFEHPHEALAGNLVANYATPDCRCLSAIQETLRDYEAKGRHRARNGDKVESVKLTAVIVPRGASQEVAQWVGLYVVVGGVPNELIGPAGDVIERSAGHGPVGYSVDLYQMPDGRWHVKDAVCLGTPGVGHEQGC
jgi:hypothetical protein